MKIILQKTAGQVVYKLCYDVLLSSNGQVVRASASAVVDSGLIPSLVEPTKIGIHSFPA